MTDRPEGMTTALYRHYDANERPLYYGISDDPAQRLATHKYQSMWTRLSARNSVEWFPTRASAEEAERVAVPADEPLFNREYNTPGYEQRLVQYLVENGLHELLVPAWPKPPKAAPQVVEVGIVPPKGRYSVALGEYLPYDDEAQVMKAPQRFQGWSRGASVLFMEPFTLRGRYFKIAEFRQSPVTESDADAYVRRAVDLQVLMADESRRFDILMGGNLFTATGEPGEVEGILGRVLAAMSRPNVRIGYVANSGCFLVPPPEPDIMLFDYVTLAETRFGEHVDLSGRSSRILSRTLDLLRPNVVTGDELRELIHLKLHEERDTPPLQGGVSI